MNNQQVFLYAVALMFVPVFLAGFTARDVVDSARRMIRRRQARIAAQQKGLV